MANVVGYLRVSTQDQAGEDRFGLAAQREAIEDYARREGHTVTAWYEDAGISGGTLDRPGLQSLLTEAPGGSFSTVVVAKMDRIARELAASLWIEKELLKAGVELVSVAEPFRGQDPANVLFRQMIGAFAQFEKSRIAERMVGGRTAKAKTGGYAGGGAPMGYQAQRGGKALTADPNKADTVQAIFTLRNQYPEWTLREIAQALNDAGHTTAQGKQFAAMQVKRVLDREDFYRGVYQYAGITAPGQQPAILSRPAS